MKTSRAYDLLRVLVRKLAAPLNHIPFRITYWDGRSDRFGHGHPQFHIRIHDWRVVWPILWHPDPALPEAYIAGKLDIENLPRMLEAYLKTSTVWRAFWSWTGWTLGGTSIPHQYKDIQAHYDLSQAFFDLWLDPTRSYSCAYFRSPTDTLADAQLAKIRYVLKKANLRPGQRLLEIGSGWGALLLEAATRYGVRAHGITLSHDQLEFTRKAICERGLQDRVSVELADYRELAQQHRAYDRIVSVGMMEHVGRKNLPVFFKAIKSLLAPGGVCVLHSMTRDRETPVSAFIQRYIFPGSYVPSWRETVALLPEFGFHLADVESLRRHYGMTLSCWADRFETVLSNVRALGFDESFIRMWRLYLRSCATSFNVGVLDLHQWIFTHGINNDLPLTRDHWYERELSTNPWRALHYDSPS